MNLHGKCTILNSFCKSLWTCRKIRIRDCNDYDYDYDIAFILEWSFQSHKTSITTTIGNPIVMGSTISDCGWRI